MAPHPALTEFHELGIKGDEVGREIRSGRGVQETSKGVWGGKIHEINVDVCVLLGVWLDKIYEINVL